VRVIIVIELVETRARAHRNMTEGKIETEAKQKCTTIHHLKILVDEQYAPSLGRSDDNNGNVCERVHGHL
jgi:hypothetical protein